MASSEGDSIMESESRPAERTSITPITTDKSARNNFHYDVCMGDLLFTEDIDLMIECLGAPSRDAPPVTLTLSDESEEALVAMVETAFRHEEGSSLAMTVDLQSLKNVRIILEDLLRLGPKALHRALRVIWEADTSINIKALIGDAGIVDFLLDLLRTNNVPEDLTILALQLVGSSCVGIEANKARVVTHGAILAILYKLWHPSLVPDAVIALHQICFGYERAQQQAANLKMARIIVDLLQTPNMGGAAPVLFNVCGLLELMLDQKTELYSDATGEILVKAAIDTETGTDLYNQLISTTTAWLQLSRIQNHFLSSGKADLLLVMIEKLGNAPVRRPLHPAIKIDKRPVDNPKLGYCLRDALMMSLVGISSDPQFSSRYLLDTKFIGALRKWLISKNPQLRICAFTVLANMVKSESASKALIQRYQIHDVIIMMVSHYQVASILDALARLTKALVISDESREAIGNKVVLKLADRLWGMNDLPYTQYLGVSMTRLCILKSLSFIQELLAPLSADPDSPASSKTYLSILLQLWKNSHGDQRQQGLVLEVARMVLELIILLWSSETVVSDMDGVELRKILLLRHPEIVYHLASLLLQQNQPIAVSKIWFVMALLADDADGAILVDQIVRMPAVFIVLATSLSRAERSELDLLRSKETRRNLLIMLSRLLKIEDIDQNNNEWEMLHDLVGNCDWDAMSREIPRDDESQT